MAHTTGQIFSISDRAPEVLGLGLRKVKLHVELHAMGGFELLRGVC